MSFFCFDAQAQTFGQILSNWHQLGRNDLLLFANHQMLQSFQTFCEYLRKPFPPKLTTNCNPRGWGRTNMAAILEPRCLENFPIPVPGEFRPMRRRGILLKCPKLVSKLFLSPGKEYILHNTRYIRWLFLHNIRYVHGILHNTR